jgi:hypothetical protein
VNLLLRKTAGYFSAIGPEILMLHRAMKVKCKGIKRSEKIHSGVLYFLQDATAKEDG